MPKLEALCACPFGVGVHPKGALFDASEHEAKILVAIGRAKYATDPVVTAIAPIVTAALEPARDVGPVQNVTPVAEPAAVPAAPTAEAVRQKRRYERRDLTADK